MVHFKKTFLAVLIPAALGISSANAAVLDQALQAEVAAVPPTTEVAVIVQLQQRANLAAVAVPALSRADRLRNLLTTLKATAAVRLPTLTSQVVALGARDIKQLWAINALAFKVPAGSVAALAKLAGVASVRPDGIMAAPISQSGGTAAAEWNLNAVQAPDLWALGFTGNGVVVANMDTGVDAMHPDLAARYRGGANSWYDPHGEHAMPYDAHGHGTQTMGIVASGAGGGTAIGMAPDAHWIAFKQYNDAGQAAYSQIHQGFQWLLDPDLNPNTDDAPHVVNASWGFAGTAGQCITEFNDDIGLLKLGGIAVALSAGNDGPTNGSSVSPANNANGYAVGAIDETQTVADFSSRGPSSCDGSIFPALMAPGVNVYTTDLSFGGLPLYMNVSGTSFAAPHVAGAMALLSGAVPGAAVAAVESALRDSAQDLGVPGPDNAYGSGAIKVRAAYDILAAAVNKPPQITSTPITAATEGIAYNYDVDATDPEGNALTYSLTQAPAGMIIDATTGIITWTPSAIQVGNQAVTVRVTDAPGLFASQSFTVAVANVNNLPVANADSYQMVQGGTLNVAAPGVLANDSDADGDILAAQQATAPASGTLTLNSNGSFAYAPVATFTGTTSFGYQAKDPSGAVSPPATVSINVLANRAPTAVNDAFTAPRRTTTAYTAQVLAVLANDSDPDTALDPANKINPATLAIVAKPNKGGTASAVLSGANAGTISYTPKRGFTGAETITYRVKDTRGATSNTATVTITVN
jgi:bacillopeptidase F